MDRKELILTALAASDGASHTPVQVQKLFFLLDKKIAAHVGEPYFDFRAWDYGPFDGTVYDELNKLAANGLVEVGQQGRLTTFRISPEGQAVAQGVVRSLPNDLFAYSRALSEWVRGLTFVELVSAIYQEYPEMKVNSVFRY